MKNQTNTNLVIRSSLALALALAIWFPVQARAAEPAEGTNMTEAKMMERCQEMKEQKQKMMEDMKAQDAQLTEQLTKMNRAPENKKMGLMAAVITHMVEQRITMDARKAKMEEEMMQHMMQHMQMGKESMSQCPMMKGMKDMDVNSGDAQIEQKGFVQDIEGLAIKNDEFRRVLYTAKHCQLVVMSLKPKEEIGAEVHKLDQFFRVEEGSGEAVLNGVRTAIRAGFAVIVPAGMNHNIINTGSVPLKLYTLYAPPNHRDGVVHHTREDAEADNEHFDGKTTE
jgi:mannose-6-phosphate isomerase-like protein (cupin superfamily)